jgi:sodium-dependent dicarboxylate transporter 2/3/5
MLFFGGLVMASAIEITRLHERLALLVLMCFGSDPKWIMLGFTLATGFMSLWITNTAT